MDQKYSYLAGDVSSKRGIICTFIAYGKTVQPNIDPLRGRKKIHLRNEPRGVAGSGSLILKRAREKAFYKGLLIYYANDKNIIAEYPDGRKIAVKPLTHAQTLRS